MLPRGHTARALVYRATFCDVFEKLFDHTFVWRVPAAFDFQDLIPLGHLPRGHGGFPRGNDLGRTQRGRSSVMNSNASMVMNWGGHRKST
ncbi:unnamed protein product [Microthlaspi erraticum]|uniref:Uncharacterized protein n=1 Tax=Microthlaspi erraticum TaxID=1685480 RepID=A0A6D2HJL6_9BRAS|nr:unnamed protein product [Microthlaspi erraticum]